ncbi:MAG: sugar ABC transporter permease [Armatimonadota bacterium]|nr:sugar ABC transporter permease [Armatimonadota bacterium]MDR5703708.1 sugar ABC transporter permease [Armatimonadota bacterium]MDR7433650.1 sugar ABC transporter permease [Armatimonadota bacterium]
MRPAGAKVTQQAEARRGIRAIPRRALLTYRTRHVLWAFAFLAPAFVLFFFIVVYPLGWALALSLQDWSFFGAKRFIGLGNYVRLWNDPLFWKSLGISFKWTIGVVPAILMISLPLALFLNAGWLRLKSLYRTGYFVPVVTNIVAVAFVWRWMFDPDFGVINWFLGVLGLPKPGWLADPAWALYAMMVVGVWKQIGQAMVLFLAGLQTIPQEFVDAAKIDGASPWKLFWKITLPLLNPTLLFVVVILVINAFRVFTIPYVMSAGGLQARTPGGPLDSTRVFVLHIYDIGFRQFQLGYASANAFVLMALIIVVTLIQIKLIQRPFEY